MEEYQKNYISTIRKKLTEILDLNTLVLAELQSEGILGKADMATLNAIPNSLEKNAKFIEMLEDRQNSYKLLTQALEQQRQSGAVELLNKIPAPNTLTTRQGQSSAGTENQVMTRQQTKPTWIINLDRYDDDIGDILNKVQPDLIAKMGTEESNTTIILELQALNLFEKQDISPILNNQYHSPQARMTELFGLIAKLDEEEIVSCLECLCNLKGVPRASAKFRTVINNHYNGSVQRA